MRAFLLTSIVILLFIDHSAQTFGPQQPIGISEAGMIDIKALDVDDDSDRDFVAIYDLTRTIAWHEKDDQSNSYTKHLIHRGLEDITQMELADMDRDGDKDIVIAHGLNYGRVVWLSNEGNGIFSAPEEYLNSYPIFEMKVMDIDYDNDVDIIIAQDAPSTFGVEAIVWYPNDEVGNIGGESTLLLTNSTVDAFDIGKLDNDSYWDIVFVKSNSNDVLILNGTGFGTFGGTTFVISPSQAVDQVLAHDVEGNNGIDDILIFRPSINRMDMLYYSGSSFVIDDWYYFESDVRLQKSNFTDYFERSVCAFNPTMNSLTILSDFAGLWYQGNGVNEYELPVYTTDVFIPLNANTMEFICFDGTRGKIFHTDYDYSADGFLESDILSSTQTLKPSNLYVGSITSTDGSVQLAVSGVTSSIFETPSILDPLNNDESSLISAYTFKLKSGDIDQDGDLDIVFIGFGNQLFVGYNEGASYTYMTVGQPIITGLNDFDLADINGDGDLDLVVMSDDGPNGYRIFTIQFIGSEQFGGQINLDNNFIQYGATSFEDFDGDGDKDVFIHSDNFNLTLPRWFENNGAGVYLTEHAIDIPQGIYCSHVVDMDSDGDLDILCYLGGATNLSWLENDGTGDFGVSNSPQHHVISTSFDNTSQVHAADIDNDGDLDVFKINEGRIELLKRTGTDSFDSPVIIDTEISFPNLGTADVDGDGDMDLFSTSFYDDRVAWYENLTNDAAGCPEDINGDGLVNINDFIQINSAYGSSCTSCPEDINGDGLVNINDFIQLNSAYGSSCDDLFGNIDQSSQLVVSSALKQDLRNQNLSTLHPSLAKHLWDTGEYISLNLFPVPNEGKQIGLRFQGISLSSKQEITYRIYDISGKLLSAKMLIADSGSDLSIQFDTQLEAGIYLLHVLVGDELLVEHFVVE